MGEVVASPVLCCEVGKSREMWSDCGPIYTGREAVLEVRPRAYLFDGLYSVEEMT